MLYLSLRRLFVASLDYNGRDVQRAERVVCSTMAMMNRDHEAAYRRHAEVPVLR